MHYYLLSNRVETDDNENFIRRWGVELSINDHTLVALTQGRLVDSWNPDTVAECDRKGPVEDMPWCSPHGYVVSQRIREILERMAPGNCQFLPVTVQYKRRTIDAGPYWVLNILNVVDCLDMVKSTIRPSKVLPSGMAVLEMVIRHELIPGNVLICRVKHDEFNVLIRSDVVTAFRGAKISGFFVFELENS